MGIKPFYYLVDDRRFVFASEIKAFNTLPGFKPVIDKYVVWDHLVFGPKPFGDTSIKGVRELEPGSTLLLRDNGFKIKKYFELEWTFERQTSRADIHYIEELLQDSINLRLRSDVPVITINSGGLDSSLVSALAGNKKPDLHTYSVVPEPGQNGKVLEGDETFFAEILARHIVSVHKDRQYLFDIMLDLSPENALCFYEQSAYLSGLLRRADRMSMQNQIEARVPFLDHRLVEALNKIVLAKKSGLLQAREKIILKRIAQNYLPRQIWRRKKYGFASPVEMYREALSSRINHLLKDARCFGTRELWMLNTIVDYHRLREIFS